MKPTACLLILAASLGAAHLALAQGGGQKAAPAIIEILGADMAPSCKDGDVDRARKLAAACDGKKQCRFDPEESDAAGESCLRESLALWSCGDGKTREAKLASQPGQSRTISLECVQPVATAAAAPPPAATQPAVHDKTETVKIDAKRGTTEKTAMAARMAPVNASEGGVGREQVRATCLSRYNPEAPEDPGYQLGKLRAGLWSAPDHSASLGACGVKTPASPGD